MAQKKSTPQPRKKAAPRPAGAPRKKSHRGAWSIACLLLGLFTLLGYFIQDYWLIDALCLYVFKGLLGWGFFLVPPVFFWIFILLCRRQTENVRRRITAIAWIPFFFGGLLHLILCKIDYGFDFRSLESLYRAGINLESGGLLAGLAAMVAKSAVSNAGAIPLFVIGFAAMLVFGSRFSFRNLAESIRSHARNVSEPVNEEPEPRPSRSRAKAAPAEGRTVPRTVPPSEIYEQNGYEQTIPAEEPPQPRRRKRVIDIPMGDEPVPGETPATDTAPEEVTEEPIPDMPRGWLYRGPRSPMPDPERAKNTPEPLPSVPAITPEELMSASGVDISSHFSTTLEPEESRPITMETEAVVPEGPQPKAPVFTAEELREPVCFTRDKVTSADVDNATGEILRSIEEAETPEAYEFPPTTLLRAGSGVMADGREEINMNRERLETTLRSFGIGASICGTTRGPTVTRYDLELESGVKLSKLTNLAGDLALALGVVSVRVAPIPDKISTVGVEVPNKIVSTVYLRDILDSPGFRNAPSKLSFAIGKDIGGNCIVGNISKLPHMLIAGTTGSGKSVCMNSLILSLLYKATPEEVRLIMIDPKMVELGIYNGIPHLYIPVVTDPKKAAGSLQWAVVEMMKRYRLFSEVGVRDLKGYNSCKEKVGEEKLPNVVIVIDELADLMMTSAKEVEESICRVAQMGRAAGMHLIIATQRPSADVITGLMKANIPSRIAFAVSSALESRIIMDNPGAEKLIGMGDMLYAPLGCGKPLRVQGAFVSDEEREAVIDFIKDGSTARYDDEILHHIERAAAKDKNTVETEEDGNEQTALPVGDNPFAGCDELLPQAVEVILDTKQASVSMLQRRLKLGYSRAARLVDQMEELGIVGPFEGSKPRQLMITREQWQEMSLTGQTPLEKLMDEQKDDFSEDKNQC